DHFASLVIETLREHREATGRTGVVVAPFDTELFGHWWFEGPWWLEAVLRKLEGQVDVVTASDFLAAHPPRSTIRLPEGSWGQGGHHWVWLNDGTRWIWEDVYRAEDAFLDVLRATRSRKDPTVRRIVSLDVHFVHPLPWLSAGGHRTVAGAGSAASADLRGTTISRRPSDRAGAHRRNELDRRRPPHIRAHGVRPAEVIGLGLRRH